jgi:serine/threonine protein kinase
VNRHEQELYCLADNVFFEQLDRLADGHDRFRLADQEPPAGWLRSHAGLWVSFQPPGRVLPDQGWKIHVSADLTTAEKAVDIVAEYCFRRGLAFKFLRSRSAVTVVNAKGAPRAGSGKLLALYPVDEAELTDVLAGLGPLLSSISGPYILSDLRIGDGPLYVRYGGFARIFCAGPDGRAVPAIRRPDGELVPDERTPVFAPPPWATLPDVVRAQQEANRTAAGTDLPYRVTAALAYSNGGGIYLAEEPAHTGDPADPSKVVLREARPDAGLDGAGRDAVERLATEYEILRRLEGLPCVPRALRRFTVWEHHFLAEEHIQGRPLLIEMLERHPLSHPYAGAEARAEYASWLTTMLDRVAQALDAIHERGVLWGDVHPSNVLVRPDGTVALIDFEAAGLVDDDRAAPLGAPGFVAPSEVTGAARDRYALDRMALIGVAPHAVNLLSVAPAKAATLIPRTIRSLPLPESLQERLRRCIPADASPDPADALFDAADWPALRGALVAGIHATATPERTDRLFPGDPEQFRDGGAGLAYGAAGVLYALHAVGEVPPDYVDWLARAAVAAPPRPFGGLCHGPLGAAAVLDRLGRPDAAAEIRAGVLHYTPPVLGLGGGQAGIALAALDAAERTGDSECLDTALRLGDTLGAAVTGADVDGALPERVGLLHGMAGVALLFVRLFQHTGETRWLDLAEPALRHDAVRLAEHANGARYALQGNKSIAHLAGGSGGVGLVLHEYLRYREDASLRGVLEQILHGMTAEYVLEAGLFEGRAGLLAVLRHCRPEAAAEITRHVRGLGAQSVTHDGRLLFAGRLSRRLSTDLATGSAGVLLALHSAFGGAAALLPGLCPPTSG